MDTGSVKVIKDHLYVLLKQPSMDLTYDEMCWRGQQDNSLAQPWILECCASDLLGEEKENQVYIT